MANGKGGSAQKPNPNKRSSQCHRSKAKANQARTLGERKDADKKLARENPKEYKLRKNTSRPLGGW